MKYYSPTGRRNHGRYTEGTCRYLRPERVNKWPNSMTDMMMMMIHEDIWLGKSRSKMSRAVLGNINTEQSGTFYIYRRAGSIYMDNQFNKPKNKPVLDNDYVRKMINSKMTGKHN